MLRLVLLISLLGLAACNAKNQDTAGAAFRNSYEDEGKALENAQCFIQDQQLCAHLIDKRVDFNLLLSPHTRNILESKKAKAQVIMRNRLSKAGAEINQCQRGDVADSIALFKGVKLRGEPVTVYGTKPLSENSRCFIYRHDQNNS